MHQTRSHSGLFGGCRAMNLVYNRIESSAGLKSSPGASGIAQVYPAGLETKEKGSSGKSPGNNGLEPAMKVAK
jgi:hypothetical protein